MCTSRKQTSGCFDSKRFSGLAAVAGLGDDLELGPGLRELARERLAQQRLVVRDQGGRTRAHQAWDSRARKSISATTPRGSRARMCNSPRLRRRAPAVREGPRGPSRALDSNP